VTERVLIGALSSPFDDERGFDAARRVLGSEDPDDVLTRLYPGLVHDSMILSAMRHLERAGGDLGALTIPAKLVRSTRPLGLVIPGPTDQPSGRVSMAALRARLRMHHALLRAVIVELATAVGPEQFMIVRGHALQAHCPAYRDRVIHDLDVLTPDLASGLRVLEALTDGQGFAMKRCRLERLSGRGLGVLGAFKEARGHRVHVDVVAGGNSWTFNQLGVRDTDVLLRARPVLVDGVRVLAAAPEDLLLMAMTRAVRKRAFDRRTLADVEVLLRDGGQLDWDYLLRSAHETRLTKALGLALAETRPDLVPPDVQRALRPGRVERLIGPGSGRSRQAGVWMRTWALRYRRSEMGAAAALLSVMRVRWDAAVLRLSIRLSLVPRRGARTATRCLAQLRPGYRSLCELRPSPAPAELGPCLAQAGTRSGDVVDLTPEAAGRLRTAILHLPTGSEEAILRSKAPNYGRGDHRCAAYVVHLRAADRLGRSTQADDLSSVRRLDARPGSG